MYMFAETQTWGMRNPMYMFVETQTWGMRNPMYYACGDTNMGNAESYVLCLGRQTWEDKHGKANIGRQT